jgi:hypothetical protein
MQSVWYFCLILTKFGISQHIFWKVLSIKFQGNLSSGSCTDAFRQLDYANMPHPPSKKILWPLYFTQYNNMYLWSLVKQTWGRKTEEVNHSFLKVAFPRTYSCLRETIIQLQSITSRKWQWGTTEIFQIVFHHCQQIYHISQSLIGKLLQKVLVCIKVVKFHMGLFLQLQNVSGLLAHTLSFLL